MPIELTFKSKAGQILSKADCVNIYSTLTTALIDGANHLLVVAQTTDNGNASGYVAESVLQQLDVTTVQIPANFAGLEDKVIPTRLKEQLFEITNVDEQDEYVEITAQHIFYQLRQNTTLWQADKTLEYTGAAVCRNILSGAMFDMPFHVASDCTDTKSGKDLDYARQNIVEAFLNPESGICKRYGLSLIRDNDVFYCLKNVGYDRGFVIEGGKNLLGVERTVNTENMVTRIAPVAWNEDGKIVWLDYNGEKYVDSPYIRNYAKPKLGIYDTEMRIGRDGVTAANVQAKLLAEAQKQFTEKKVDQPAVTMKIEFVSLGDTEEYSQYKGLDKVYLYDILSIKDNVRGYSYQAEVVGVEHDILTGRLNSVTIGTLQDWNGIRKVATWQIPEVNGEKIRLESIRAGMFETNAINSSDIRSGAIDGNHFSADADNHFKTIFAEQLYISNTSPDGLLNTRFSVDEGSITALVTKTGINSLGQDETLYSKLQVTAEAITAEVSRASAAEGTLSGRLTVAADAITAEVTRATTAEGTLSGRLTVASDAITAEVTRATTAEGDLSGRITVAADAITAEVTRATLAEGGLQEDFSQLEITVDGITQTVGTITGQVDSLDTAVTSITGSALWTQRNAITGVVGEMEVVEDLTTHEKRLVIKSGGGLKIEKNNVEYGVYDDGNLTAGVVASIVNGVSSTYIYGSNIVMSSTDNTPVNVEIAGKLTAEDITANLISAKISDISLVTVQSLVVNSGGYINSNGYIYAPEFVIGTNSSGGGSNKYISNAITELQIIDGTTEGTYKLQKKDFGDSAWVDVGTFNRAATTTLDEAWSSGTITVTASPQGETLSRTLVQDTAGITWNGNSATVPINATWGSSGQYSESTGWNVYVNAQGRYNQGSADGWALARAEVQSPSAGTNTTMSVGVPSSTYGQSSSLSFSVDVDADYAYIKNWVGTVVARKANSYTPSGTINVVTDGWVNGSEPSIEFEPSSGSGTSSTATVKIVQNSGDSSGNGSIKLQGKVDSGSWSDLTTLAVKMVADSNWSSDQKTIHLRYGESDTDRATLTVDASSIRTAGANSVTISSVTQNSGAIYNSSTKKYSVGVIATASNGNTGTGTLTFSASEAYNAGWGGAVGEVGSSFTVAAGTVSLAVPSGTVGSGTTKSITIAVNASADWANGSKTVYAKAGGTNCASSVVTIPNGTITLGAWSAGSRSITATTGGKTIATSSVTVPAATAYSWVNTEARKWRCDMTLGGVIRSTSVKDFGSYYTDGQTAAGLTYNTSNHTISRAASSSTKTYTVSMSSSGWSSGSNTIYASLGSGININSTSVSIPTVSASDWSASYIGLQSGVPKMSVTLQIGGASRTGTVSAAGAYNAGISAYYNSTYWDKTVFKSGSDWYVKVPNSTNNGYYNWKITATAPYNEGYNAGKVDLTVNQWYRERVQGVTAKVYNIYVQVNGVWLGPQQWEF